MDLEETKSGDAFETNAENKNMKLICCPLCEEVIFSREVANLVSQQFSLPEISKENTGNIHKMIEFDTAWQVTDQFNFENIGFLNKTGDVQYLICANCDYGPLGYTENSKTFMISCTRTKQLKEDEIPKNSKLPEELSLFLENAMAQQSSS
ncbi:hypothetical protein Ciccas_008853 [Cichlidogyrus casuarinus]|uniref:Guanine nucleotide exchange factor MSS4 n=1 Tax=Cichlidogyrus casuarinus TaxID=1844966 RepID=A0ABD2PZN5_9PLAT